MSLGILLNGLLAAVGVLMPFVCPNEAAGGLACVLGSAVGLMAFVFLGFRRKFCGRLTNLFLPIVLDLMGHLTYGRFCCLLGRC